MASNCLLEEYGGHSVGALNAHLEGMEVGSSKGGGNKLAKLNRISTKGGLASLGKKPKGKKSPVIKPFPVAVVVDAPPLEPPAVPHKPVINLDELEDGAGTDEDLCVDDFSPCPRGYEAVCLSHGTRGNDWAVSIEPTYHNGNNKDREFAKAYLAALQIHYGRDRKDISDKDIIHHALGYAHTDVCLGKVEAFTYNDNSKRIFWHRKFNREKVVNASWRGVDKSGNTVYPGMRVKYNRSFILRSVE
tara:strand:+ start:26 stop:763 length:738 start_codon:yes stop_codon:yes gene_type:complete